MAGSGIERGMLYGDGALLHLRRIAAVVSAALALSLLPGAVPADAQVGSVSLTVHAWEVDHATGTVTYDMTVRASSTQGAKLLLVAQYRSDDDVVFNETLWSGRERRSREGDWSGIEARVQQTRFLLETTHVGVLTHAGGESTWLAGPVRVSDPYPDGTVSLSIHEFDADRVRPGVSFSLQVEGRTYDGPCGMGRHWEFCSVQVEELRADGTVDSIGWLNLPTYRTHPLLPQSFHFHHTLDRSVSRMATHIRAVLQRGLNYNPDAEPRWKSEWVPLPWPVQEVEIPDDIEEVTEEELDLFVGALAGVSLSSLCLPFVFVEGDRPPHTSMKTALFVCESAVRSGATLKTVLAALAVVGGAGVLVFLANGHRVGEDTDRRPRGEPRPAPPPPVLPGQGGPPTTVDPVEVEIVAQTLLDRQERATAELDRRTARVIAEQCLSHVQRALAAGLDFEQHQRPCRSMNIFVPADDVREAARHDRRAIISQPEWVRLNFVATAARELDIRRRWHEGDRRCQGRSEQRQCDEYPFFSTAQGGPGASLELVRAEHNRREGSFLRTFYSGCDLQSGGAEAAGGDPFQGSPYLVVPIPHRAVPNTMWFCETPVEPDLPEVPV